MNLLGPTTSAIRTILAMLTRRERFKLAVLLVAMLMMAVMELTGIATVLPFMQLVADPSAISENAVLGFLYSSLGFQTEESFLVFAGVALLALIAVANGASAFTVWLMQRFAWTQNHLLAVRLFERYLSRPYAYFLNQNTATLSRTLLEEVQNAVSGVILPLLKVVARGFTTLLILAFLTWVNPLLTLAVVFLFGGAYSTIYVYLRRKQRRLGRARVRANADRFRIAGEGLRGIKTVKVMGREREFLRRFAPASRVFSTATATNQIVSRLPRYALETIAFGGVLVTLLFYLGVEGNVQGVLPVLSVYAFAAYRLMPALNELFASAVQIRFSVAALDELERELLDPEGTGSGGRLPSDAGGGLKEPLSFQRELGLEAVSFRYEGASTDTLKDISLSIPKHAVVGLVGSTGSGKTTLVDLILGLLSPTGGRIVIDDVELTPENVRAWTVQCGYVPQDIFLSDDTIRANIAFGLPAEEIDEGAIHRAASLAQMHEFVMGLDAGYDAMVGEAGVRLSGGQRQRIGIARALYSDPEVLVLDEATSALDGATERAVIDTIQALARKKTLIVIAHRLSTVERCDTIHVLSENGILASGTYEELAAADPTFRMMAGLEPTTSPEPAGPQ